MANVVELGLACNDTRGDFAGRCEMVELWWSNGEHVSLSGKRVSVCFVDASPSNRSNKLRVSRRTFEITGRRRWEGNVFWEGTTMSSAEAVRLISYLTEELGWVCDEETEFPNV